MIRQLQTTLAPAFVLERLEKKPTPTSQTKSAEKTDPQKPKPQARQKVKITFQKQVQQPEAGEAASEAEVSRGVTIIDKRAEDMVNRADILERLRTVLPVHISKASEKSQSQQSKLSPKRSTTFIPDAAAAEADTSLLTRQIVIIRKLPSRIFLVEDVSLVMGATAEPPKLGTGVETGKGMGMGMGPGMEKSVGAGAHCLAYLHPTTI
jgi:hypothetical protein